MLSAFLNQIEPLFDWLFSLEIGIGIAVTVTILSYLLGLFTTGMKKAVGECMTQYVKDKHKKRSDKQKWHQDVNYCATDIVDCLYPEKKPDEELETAVTKLVSLRRSSPDSIDPEIESEMDKIKNIHDGLKRQASQENSPLAKGYEKDIVKAAMGLVIVTRDEIENDESILPSLPLVGR